MLKGNVALITGGGTGIGRAIALILAKAGVNIAINYSRSEADALKTKAEAESLGVRCSTYRADVANDQEVRIMVKKVINDFGKLDILINNAGMTHFVDHVDLEGLKDEYWDDIMGVNVKGTFFAPAQRPLN